MGEGVKPAPTSRLPEAARPPHCTEREERGGHLPVTPEGGRERTVAERLDKGKGKAARTRLWLASSVFLSVHWM